MSGTTAPPPRWPRSKHGKKPRARGCRASPAMPRPRRPGRALENCARPLAPIGKSCKPCKPRRPRRPRKNPPCPALPPTSRCSTTRKSFCTALPPLPTMVSRRWNTCFPTATPRKNWLRPSPPTPFNKYPLIPPPPPARLRPLGLRQVLFNAPAGRWDAGERGLACLPGRQAEFHAALEQALAYAQVLECPRIHVMAGLVPQGVDAATVRATYVANLRHAAKQAAPQGIDILLEPIN